MKRLRTHLIGIEQGDVPIFADFENGGEMWTGHGARERRIPVVFSEPFLDVPAVHVGLSLSDIDSGPHQRIEILAEKVTRVGFDLVFRTWGDSRVARVRMNWTAIGELANDDDWEIR